MSKRRDRGGVALGFATGALLLGATAASAALSPLYQSIREIQAILDDPRLAAAFPDQSPVHTIQVIEDDLYVVGAGTCSVEVHIVDTPPKPGERMMLGPRKFTLQFDEPLCESEEQ